MRRTVPLYEEIAAPFIEQAAAVATCRRGCAHCCFKYVDGTLAEGAVIAAHLLETPRLARTLPQVRQGLLDRLALVRCVDGDENAYLRAQIPCVFLDVRSHDCTIYAARPLACRLHFVVSDPAHCSPEQPDAQVAYVASAERYAAFIAASSEAAGDAIPQLGGSLPALVLGSLELLQSSPRTFERWLTAHRDLFYASDFTSRGHSDALL